MLIRLNGVDVAGRLVAKVSVLMPASAAVIFQLQLGCGVVKNAFLNPSKHDDHIAGKERGCGGDG